MGLEDQVRHFHSLQYWICGISQFQHAFLSWQTHTYVNTVDMEGDLSMRHCVHSLPEVRPSTFPETTHGAMPVGGQGNPQSNMRCCPMEEHNDQQVFLTPASQEVKFMLGPTPAQRHQRERERRGHNPHNLQPVEGATGSETEREEPSLHLCSSHSYHHFHHHSQRHPGLERSDSCQSGELTYENINGLRSSRKHRLSPSSVSQSVGSSSSSSTGDSHSHSLLHLHAHGPSSLPLQGYACERGGGHRRAARLNYENLPSLPPVWEYSALQREDEQDEEDDEEEYEEEEEDFDDYEFSEGSGTPNGYHPDGGGIHRDALQNYVNTEQVHPPQLRHACPPHPRPCQPDRGGRIFNFDLRRRSRSGVGGCEHGHMPPLRQLNYIQVDLDGDSACQPLSSGGAQTQPQHQRLLPKKCGPPASRRSECYAVIDLKKTAAMSNLQKALPRDDGTSRKTRHNSTDLPL